MGLLVNVIAGMLAFFLIYTALFGALPQFRQRSLYLLFALVILFLVYPACSNRKKNGVPWYDYIFALLSFITCGYVVIMYERILLTMGISTSVDQVMFIILTVLVLEGTRRLVSPALAIVTIVFLLYILAIGSWNIRIKTGGIPRLC